MNRNFALFVALCVLVAHALSILETSLGAIAPPSDYAHATFRFARNWVRSDALVWDLSDPVLGGVPSFLWALVAAIAERISVPVTNFCQALGCVFALLTAFMLSRFSPNRAAGVIAPLLFVMSGAVATAAGSGSETSMLAFLLTSSLLAFERRSSRAVALFTTLAVLTRPEGAVFTLFLLLLELRPFRPRQENGAPSRAILWGYLPALLALLALAIARKESGAAWLSPWLVELFPGGPERWRANLSVLRDAIVGSGGPLLFVFPLWYAARGLLSPMGVRACFLTLVWAALVVLGGSRPEPFGQSLVPILAILFLAVQVAMTRALDSHRRFLPQTTWVLFVAGLGLSLMASKFPGSLEPAWVEKLHRAWMTPSTPPRFGHYPHLGRTELQGEIDTTETLRAIGLFLRDDVRRGSTVLTPWPGAIGYLSRLTVIDLLGRATRDSTGMQHQPWNFTRRTDVLAKVDQKPDYIVPIVRMPSSAPSVRSIAVDWIAHLDHSMGSIARGQRLHHEFSTNYELITVPVSPFTPPGTLVNDRLYLMRRRDLGYAPQLEVRLEAEAFRVLVRHFAHEQIVDLRVELQGDAGESWTLTPSGQFLTGGPYNARTSLLLVPSGDQAIELARSQIPKEWKATRMIATLLNPGAGGESAYDEAGSPVAVDL